MLRKIKILNIIKWFLSFIIIFLALIIILGTNWALENIEISNFDQILFTLTNSVSAASNSIINSFIKASIIKPFIITITIIIVVLILKHLFKYLNANIIIKLKNHTLKLNFYIIIKYFALACLITYSIYYTMNNLYIFDYIKHSGIKSSFFEENYVDPNNVELEWPSEKRNLIYIFLESMEATYTDKSNGGAYDVNYMIELTDLANDNINFSSNNLIGGAYMLHDTSWTMAGMVAHTAGIPLKTLFNQDDENTYKDGVTLAGAYSLGDILKDAGYRQYIMVGSDLTFGGRRVYFKSHGDYTVFDYYTAIEDGIIDEGYYVNWGYEDSKLFDYAKQELEEIAKDDEPFNFTLLTANTHFPEGYVDEECEYQYDNHYLTSVACSSKELNDFIEWIQKQDFYQNTTIILVGDHLSMNSYSFDNIDTNYDRRVFNIFINSAIDTDCTKNRDFSTLDFYPTTLAALGVSIKGERLGLGTNLFSCKKTLSEIYGNDYIDEELKNSSTYYDACIANECDE